MNFLRIVGSVLGLPSRCHMRFSQSEVIFDWFCRMKYVTTMLMLLQEWLCASSIFLARQHMAETRQTISVAA